MVENEKAIAKCLRELTVQVVRNVQIAAVLGYNGNILAAKIMSARTDAERNQAIKDSQEVAEEAISFIKDWEKEWGESKL
jgi:hypothetical protein